MTRLPGKRERQLVDYLNSLEPTAHAEARQEIRTYSADQLTELTRQAARMQSSPGGRITRLAALPALLALGLLARYSAASTSLTGIIVLVWTVFLLSAIVLLQFVPRRDMTRAFQALAAEVEVRIQIEDLPGLLALLAEERESDCPGIVRAGARAALRRLLPQLQRQDFEAMGISQQSALVHLLLNPYADTPLGLTIIETLGRVADPFDRDLDARLSAFAKQSAATANMQQVRTSAQAALHQLDKRRRDATEGQSLLRAAVSGPSDAPNTLLRAAEPHATLPPEQMLRPSALPNATNSAIASNSGNGVN